MSASLTVEIPWPTYRVRLRHEGRSRLEMMKLIRSWRPEVTLAAAKALLDPRGRTILTDVPHLRLDRLRRELDELGAKYEVSRT